MILLSGGIDGGDASHVVEMAEMIAVSNPRARNGSILPVLYAGNKNAGNAVKDRLESKVALDFAENIRPTMELENPGPARKRIQDLFLEHVMSHAPGYPGLIALADHPIIPTPPAYLCM